MIKFLKNLCVGGPVKSDLKWTLMSLVNKATYVTS